MKKTNLIWMMGILTLTLCPAAWSFTGALSITPASGTHAPAEEWNVDVVLNTGGETVLTVQTYIDFDPAKLEVVGGNAGITVNAAFVLVVEKKVDGSKIKIVAGALGGVTGAAQNFATIHLKALTEGSACLNFDQANSQAQKDTTENVIATFNDSCFTIGPAPIRYDFESDPEGWTFSGGVDIFTPPTDSASDGCLNMQAVNNTDVFGFWYSPTDAIPELLANNIYRARFGIKSDQTDKSLVPSFRARFNASNFKQGDLVMINSNGAGDASPDTSVKDYDLYFRPQGGALEASVTGILSFDMVNMNPNDSANAMLSLDYVQVDRVAIADLGTSTPIQTYTFDGDIQGWSHTEVIGSFEKPTFTFDDIGGTLAMECNSNNNTFGFWQNAQDELSVDHAVLYQLRVSAAADPNSIAKAAPEPVDPPLLRLRLYDHPSNQMSGLYQAPIFKYDVSPPPISKLEALYSDYYLYFLDSYGVGPNLGIAVDIVNLDPAESPTGNIIFTEVELLSFSPIP